MAHVHSCRTDNYYFSSKSLNENSSLQLVSDASFILLQMDRKSHNVCKNKLVKRDLLEMRKSVKYTQATLKCLSAPNLKKEGSKRSS